MSPISSGDTVLAFDTGPGNAPIDDWMQRHTGKPVDEDGALARTRQRRRRGAGADAGQSLSSTRAPPKSLDRMDFGIDAVEGLSPADGAATLTAFTAAAIAKAREHFPEPADDLDRLRRRTAQQHADGRAARARERAGAAAEDAGWNGDSIEAEASPISRCARTGPAASLPTTTGWPAADDRRSAKCISTRAKRL